MANTVGSGKFTYEMVERWGTLPSGWTFGPVSAIATDSQDRVYAFQRKDPPVVVFDRLGNYIGSWGEKAITDPHGFYIKNDIVYLTDRDDHVVLKYTLDGKPLRLIGERGKASDTGCDKDGGRVLRAAGPFNKPTEMVPGPNGDLYVTDGYRNSRVHRFSADGRLISSWGEPGKKEPNEFHLPHSLWIDEQGTIYVCDRENSRIQLFSLEGKYIAQWGDLDRPADIYIDASETVYVSDLKPSVVIMDKKGNKIARWDTPAGHGLWADSHGDIYLADVAGHAIHKYVHRRA
jgi:DNA-binding beta-propeller fold protein YncE